MKKKRLMLGAFLVILALIVLPTGTPEDLFTTVPLLNYLGWKNFLFLSLFLVLAIVWSKGREKKK